LTRWPHGTNNPASIVNGAIRVLCGVLTFESLLSRIRLLNLAATVILPTVSKLKHSLAARQSLLSYNLQAMGFRLQNVGLAQRTRACWNWHAKSVRTWSYFVPQRTKIINLPSCIAKEDCLFLWSWLRVAAIQNIATFSWQHKSAPSSPSRSPTACRFKHSHLASRVSQGERRVSEG